MIEDRTTDDPEVLRIDTDLAHTESETVQRRIQRRDVLLPRQAERVLNHQADRERGYDDSELGRSHQRPDQRSLKTGRRRADAKEAR